MLAINKVWNSIDKKYRKDVEHFLIRENPPKIHYMAEDGIYNLQKIVICIYSNRYDKIELARKFKHIDFLEDVEIYSKDKILKNVLQYVDYFMKVYNIYD